MIYDQKNLFQCSLYYIFIPEQKNSYQCAVLVRASVTHFILICERIDSLCPFTCLQTWQCLPILYWTKYNYLFHYFNTHNSTIPFVIVLCDWHQPKKEIFSSLKLTKYCILIWVYTERMRICLKIKNRKCNVQYKDCVILVHFLCLDWGWMKGVWMRFTYKFTYTQVARSAWVCCWWDFNDVPM